MGVKLFSSPPLPQNPFDRSQDFDGFEVIGGPQKSLKIWSNYIEWISRYFAIRIDPRLLDTIGVKNSNPESIDTPSVTRVNKITRYHVTDIIIDDIIARNICWRTTATLLLSVQLHTHARSHARTHTYTHTHTHTHTQEISLWKVTRHGKTRPITTTFTANNTNYNYICRFWNKLHSYIKPSIVSLSTSNCS